MNRGSFRPRPARSAAALELADLKMTTVGALVKEMKAAGGSVGMTGVHGAHDAEATVVCFATGDDAQLLVDAFLVFQRELTARKGYKVVQQGEHPTGPGGNAPALANGEAGS